MSVTSAVRFEVECPNILQGQRIGVCGSSEELGSWDPNKCMELVSSDEHLSKWLAPNPVKVGVSTKFKFIALSPAGDVRWEDGSDREFPSPLEHLHGRVRFSSVFNSPRESVMSDDGPTAVLAEQIGQPDVDASTEKIVHEVFNSQSEPVMSEGGSASVPAEQLGQPDVDVSTENIVGEVFNSLRESVMSDDSFTAVPAEEIDRHGIDMSTKKLVDPIPSLALEAVAHLNEPEGELSPERRPSRRGRSLTGVQTEPKEEPAVVPLLPGGAARLAAVGAVAGGVGLGAGGAITGLTIGSIAGAACGLLPAVFTFGLSVPIGAALGGGAGMGLGTAFGTTAGAAGGGIVGYGLAKQFKGKVEL